MSMTSTLCVLHRYGTARPLKNVHESHPCIIIALSETNKLQFKEVTKANPLFGITKPQEQCYIQLHM